MTDEPTHDDVKRALESLGTTSADVARTLVALGIRGKSGAYSCPIARFIRQKFDLPHEAVIVRHSGRVLIGDSLAEIPPTYGVCGFVADYDSGRYPDLREPLQGQ